MPGFMVKDLGVDVANPDVNSQKPIYVYTWELSEVLGDAVRPDESLIMCKTITTPTFAAGIMEVEGASLKYKFADDIKWDDIRITWYDTVGLCAFIRKWRRSVWSHENNIAVAGDYKKTTGINIFSFDHVGTASKEWKLYGCWPSLIKDGDLTYSDSDIKIVEVSLTYDWADDISGCGETELVIDKLRYELVGGDYQGDWSGPTGVGDQSVDGYPSS